MFRNPKARCVAVVAACAIGAALPSAAHAVPNGVFTAGITAPLSHTATFLHGEQLATAPDVFKTEKGKVECSDKETTFTIHEGDATMNGTATTAIATPEYKHCLAEGTKPATFETAQFCDFRLQQPEALNEADTMWTGKVDLTCGGLAPLVIDVYAMGTVTAHSVLSCKITIFQKQNLAHVVYDNVAANKDYILATIKVTGL
ncbi:MAG TPA: hypothetical protein VFU04_02935, partial [Solirubrobacterales bacterium]|nr:hypothetical protein [Solirubrobacterales bacterium]